MAVGAGIINIDSSQLVKSQHSRGRLCHMSMVVSRFLLRDRRNCRVDFRRGCSFVQLVCRQSWSSIQTHIFVKALAGSDWS